MNYLSYAIVATLVIFLSIKTAKYIDIIDKTTTLSGAFIGGILLSAVTSLPELLTTVSAAILLDNPSLSIGNILGSNLFNLTIFSILVLLSGKKFKNASISKIHSTTTLLLFFIYIALILNFFKLANFEVLGLSITSIFILTLYIIGIKTMASDDSEEFKEEDIKTDLSLNQIVFRFVLASIGLVLFSVLITYITDIISVKLNLGAGLAGALFLGIATSLPEVTTCIALVKRDNFNVAVGNILGSNIFNFLVIFIADFIYTKGTIYLFGDKNIVYLILFGAIATPLMLFVLNGKKEKSYVFPSICIMICYLLFLTL